MGAKNKQNGIWRVLKGLFNSLISTRLTLISLVLLSASINSFGDSQFALAYSPNAFLSGVYNIQCCALNLTAAGLPNEHDAELTNSSLPITLVLLMMLMITSIISLKLHKNWLSYLLFLIFMVLLEQSLEGYFHHEQSLVEKNELREEVNSIILNLDREINKNTSLLIGLSAFIKSTPNYTDEEFNRYAAAIFETDHALVNMAVAPDLVISHVYPLAGNEAALGLDYNKTPAQLAAAMHTKQSRSIVIAGPITLVQGGEAFIGRSPVFLIDPLTNQETFWGIVSTPVLKDRLFSDAGLLSPHHQVNIAIRGKDGKGTEGEIFFGDPSIFSNSKNIKVMLPVGSGYWQIAIEPKSSSNTATSNLLSLRTAFIVVIVLFSALFSLWHKQAQTKASYEMEIKKFSSFLEEIESISLVGGFRLDQQLRLTQASEQTYKILNLKNDQETHFSNLTHSLGDENKGIAENLRRIWYDKNPIDIEVELDSEKGEKQWIRLIAEPVLQNGDVVELLGAIQDISQKKRTEYLIDLKENYDSLTHLPNRNLFREQLSLAIKNASQKSQQIALLILDIDNFKSINENLSQNLGDDLLIQFADRLASIQNETSVLSRLSGDEFALLFTDIHEYTEAYNLAEDILNVISSPFLLAKEQVFIGVSIGIAIYPNDADSQESLMRNANQAMQDVKSSSKNSWRFFTKEMQNASEKKHSIYHTLSQAVEDGSIIPHYQPIIDLVTGKTVGCEALARWQRSDGLFVSPVEFIPIAEESDLIIRIDSAILQQAITTVEEINQQLSKNISMSVNVSPKLFYSTEKVIQDWLDIVDSKKSTTPLSIEITERLLMDELQTVQHVLNRLSHTGAKLSIDDFGTGYSSLSYLCRFPVNTIKIDRSFICASDSNSVERTLVETILLMAKKLDMDVIAEGIEEITQHEFLVQQGCNHGQGYLFGKPMSEQDFIKHVAQQ